MATVRDLLRRPITLVGLFGVAALVLLLAGGRGGGGAPATGARPDPAIPAAGGEPARAPVGRQAAMLTTGAAGAEEASSGTASDSEVAGGAVPEPVVSATQAPAAGPTPAPVAAAPATSPTAMQEPAGSPALARPQVFQIDVHHQWRLFIVDAPGEQPRELSTGDWDDGEPALSPDGRMIAFVSDRAGPFHIYVMNTDGSEVRQLTYGNSNDRAPAWSVDGALITFTSDREGEPGRQYSVAVSGGEVRAASPRAQRRMTAALVRLDVST